jgi:hypothetical protein
VIPGFTVDAISTRKRSGQQGFDADQPLAAEMLSKAKKEEPYGKILLDLSETRPAGA